MTHHPCLSGAEVRDSLGIWDFDFLKLEQSQENQNKLVMVVPPEAELEIRIQCRECICVIPRNTLRQVRK